jgi:hypothetical protein
MKTTGKFHFSFATDWRHLPAAYWVHIPVEGVPHAFLPPAPIGVPHKGFAVLHVEFQQHELVFSSAAQLDHYIEILSKTPLPTTRQLSALRHEASGPNSHWLSRLPAELKASKVRPALVKALLAAKAFAAAHELANSFIPPAVGQ